MAVRNHITRIVAAEPVVTQDEQAEEKVTADLKKDDPVDTEKTIIDNTVEQAEKERPNPDTQLDTFETLVRDGVIEDEEKEKQDENEGKKKGSKKKA